MTLTEIFRRHGGEYLHRFEKDMLPSHKKSMRDIILCRSEYLGWHEWYCEHCQRVHYTYNPCKNRSCPQCQNDKCDQWIINQKDLLLPVEYFMVTFTIPEELRRFARSHQKKIYHILFQTSAHSLKTLAKDPRFLGGQIGMIGLLQTWTSTLEIHPHIHYIVPGIAISFDHKQIIYAREGFLMHEKPLARIFRRLFKKALIKAGLIHLVPAHVWKIDWVVDCESVGDGLPAIKYLAKYVYRIAISNNNILSCKNRIVTFRYKDNQTKKYLTMTLPVLEFMRRFLQHVLPKGLQKVRYFGFLHPKNKKIFNLVRLLLKAKFIPPDNHISKEVIFRCPECGGAMVLITITARKRAPPLNQLFKEYFNYNL